MVSDVFSEGTRRHDHELAVFAPPSADRENMDGNIESVPYCMVFSTILP